MSSDNPIPLLKRLRTMAAIGWNPIGDEAADEIERMRDEIKRLQSEKYLLSKALKRSLSWLSSYPGALALGAYNEAREALKLSESKGDSDLDRLQALLSEWLEFWECSYNEPPRNLVSRTEHALQTKDKCRVCNVADPWKCHGGTPAIGDGFGEPCTCPCHESEKDNG